MKKLSDSLYAQEEGSLLLHSHGPEITPWCLVNTEIAGKHESKLIAMFAELDDALAFAETKVSAETSVPGREWRVSDEAG
jgi:hypothetical protein